MEFGRYRLLSRIGRGGMAEVYRALAVGPGGFEKEVVVKRILPALSVEPSFADMFLDEARIASRLDHPNIVQIHDLGCVDETYFIVMEYVRGMDLSALVTALAPTRPGEPPLETAVALRIVGDVCRALDYAHRTTGPDGAPLGLVHRDVSPQNVLVSDEGTVKLADFGIARAMQGGTRRTLRGLVRGKAKYMSPEQARGLPLDARSDVYAAGIVLYELLTHRHPYAVGDVADTLVRASAPIIEVPSAFVPIDAELDALTMHALAASPDERFSSAAALLEAIETHLHDARLRVGPAEIARAVRRARDAEPARIVSLDAAIAGELGSGGTPALGDFEVTTGTDRTGLPVFRRTSLAPLSDRDALTLDEPMPSPPAAPGLAPVAPVATVPMRHFDARANQPFMPSVVPSATAIEAAATPDDDTGTTAQTRTRSSRAVQIGAVLLALALGSALTMIVLDRRSDTVGPSPRPSPPAGRGGLVPSAPSPSPPPSHPPSPAPSPSHPPSPAPSPSPSHPPSPAPSPSLPPSTPVRRPERETADRRPARLDIGARPNWATIHIDGRLVGTTPCTAMLPPGTHTVVARNATLGLSQRRRITLSPGARRRLVFDPF